MDGFQRRKEHSKENIRLAAHDLFSRLGINKVSINDIARQAGVSPVTIYNHFDGKESLVREYVLSVTKGFVERLEAILREEGPYAEKLKAVFQSLLETEEQSKLDMAEIHNDPGLRQILDAVAGKQFKFFAELVGEGKKQKYLSADFSDEAIKAYLEIVMQGMRASPELHARVHRDPQMFHDLVLLMLYGFAGEPRTASR